MLSRREAILSAGAIFLVALLVRAWAASQITFPRPEDVAYYVGVARNLVEGRGLTTDAIWSFQTPPLSFPRPAFEVWLPLPSLLAAIPMAILGTTFAAAQVSSVLVGSFVCVLAWRLAVEVAAARGMPLGRARTLAVGTGLTAAVYLPLVLASAQPDSTMPFAALALLACMLMARLERTGARFADLLALGALLGIAALTRNEAAWLALTWAIVAWPIARRRAVEPVLEPSRDRSIWATRSDRRFGRWFLLVAPAAIVAMIVFGPWAYRDWLEFGSPFPGQALVNALSLQGTDIFAWRDQPTLARYLAAGPVRLLELRWIGTVHNLTQVLLLLGIPLSIVGLAGLAALAGWRGRGPSVDRARPDPTRPLLIFSILTFLVASLIFPVSTTWGTFLHAAGAIHVLLVLSALLALDWFIGWVGRRRGWTNPVAWLGPAFAIVGCLLFTVVLLQSDGAAARHQRERYEAIALAFSGVDASGRGVDLAAEAGPVISDFPIWFAEATRHHTLALPHETIESVLDLARTFDPPARYLVVDAGGTGPVPAAILAGEPGAECFVPVALPDLAAYPGRLDDFLAFRIRCQ